LFLALPSLGAPVPVYSSQLSSPKLTIGFLQLLASRHITTTALFLALFSLGAPVPVYSSQLSSPKPTFEFLQLLASRHITTTVIIFKTARTNH
jgi:hypothetical protein